jgi:hypothetical protein
LIANDCECFWDSMTFDHTPGRLCGRQDGPIELMAAIVALLVNLNRLTDDLRAWASAADAIDMAWVRSLTSSLLAKVPELASLGKEFGENPECFFSIAVELGTAFDGAGRTISLLTSLVNRCVQNVAALQLPRVSSITQTDLVEIFVTRGGVDQTTAQTMAREVERLVAKGEIDFESLTPEAMNVIGIQLAGRPINLTQTDIASAIDPAQRIAARSGPGGAAPDRVVEMLTECRARLVRENLWVSIAGQRIAKSEALLSIRHAKWLGCKRPHSTVPRAQMSRGQFFTGSAIGSSRLHPWCPAR